MQEAKRKSDGAEDGKGKKQKVDDKEVMSLEQVLAKRKEENKAVT